uniref:Pks26 protein n=1 Tax=Fopius arisanus TaxID=64838 RepID=A0A0C9QN51_9HYME
MPRYFTLSYFPPTGQSNEYRNHLKLSDRRKRDEMNISKGVRLLKLLSGCFIVLIIISESKASVLSFSSEESIEIPSPRRIREYIDTPHHRPVIELILGILDTFHSSTKSEIRRTRSRQERNTLESTITITPE